MKNHKNPILLQQIWVQALANAFVFAFERSRDAVGFDRASEFATMEAPETIADLAVLAWLAWNEDGRGEKWRGIPSQARGAK